MGRKYIGLCNNNLRIAVVRRTTFGPSNAFHIRIWYLRIVFNNAFQVDWIIMSDKIYSYLERFCVQPQEEIENIKKSFEEHVSLAGQVSYRPKVMLFDFIGNKKFGISSKPYETEKDFYVTISEMMYSYTSFYAKSCILVLDSNSKTHDDSSGSLVIYFANDEAAAVYKHEYRYTDTNSIVWVEPKNAFEEIDLKDKTYGNRIIEILFVHTHLENPPFTQQEILSYYSMKGYNFRSFKDLSVSYLDYSFKS